MSVNRKFLYHHPILHGIIELLILILAPIWIPLYLFSVFFAGFCKWVVDEIS